MSQGSSGDVEQDLDAMLSRIHHLTTGADPNELAPLNSSTDRAAAPGPPQPIASAPPLPSHAGIAAGPMNQLQPSPAAMNMQPVGGPLNPGQPGRPQPAGPLPNGPPPGQPRQMQQPSQGGGPMPLQQGPPGAPQRGNPGQPQQGGPAPGIMRVNQPGPMGPASGPPVAGQMPMGPPHQAVQQPGGQPNPGPNPGAPNFAPPGQGAPSAGMSPAMAPAGGGFKDLMGIAENAAPVDFLPSEPRSLREAGLNESSLESLILKYLLARGEDSGQGVSDQIKIPFTIIQEMLSKYKYDQLIFFKDTAAMGDYVCALTEKGRDRARGFSNDCTYYGSAPVSLKDYCAAVAAQSLTHQSPSEEDLRRAFSDLLVNPNMFLRLGAAMNSGRGMFLFGFPGNGKTSIAERVTRAFGEHIWIPRSLGIDGEIIRVFDPSQHEEAPLEEDDSIVDSNKVDKRWVRIERPTLIVGGELTMDNLELSMNRETGINEAPIQLKSNCGTLVIDDFGRQRMTTDELLNRWIVPLEKRYDFLNLPSGKKIQVPFDQLVIFSTNLEPKDLVDDAFLRRIPYKIEVENPTEEEFRKLFEIMCPLMGFDFHQPSIDYLIERHYKPIDRPFRCCQPRDLLLQIKNYCKYLKKPMVLNNENFDFATTNYFSVM